MPYQLLDLRTQIAALEQYVPGLKVDLHWPGVPSGTGWSEASVSCAISTPRGQRFDEEHRIEGVAEQLAATLRTVLDNHQGNPNVQALVDNIRRCPVT